MQDCSGGWRRAAEPLRRTVVLFEEMDEAQLRLHPVPRQTDAEVDALAPTVARRTLALLRTRGVLEEEHLPDGALDVLPARRHPGAPAQTAS